MEQIYSDTLQHIIKPTHENKWIAIAGDYTRVLAVADTLSDLMREVTDREAVFHRVLPRNVVFVPIASK